MPKACRVCGFAPSHLINFALRSGQPVAEVRQQWRHLSTTALERHQRWCLGLPSTGDDDESVQRVRARR